MLRQLCIRHTVVLVLTVLAAEGFVEPRSVPSLCGSPACSPTLRFDRAYAFALESCNGECGCNQDPADDVGTIHGRRGFLCATTLALTFSALLPVTWNQPAWAVAADSQEDIDKANILKGYSRLKYLLENWEKETTVCKIGGDSLEKRCERTPIKVMDYLGYKATNDPLFKAEKTLRRLYVLAPPDRDVEYFEALERYAENADEASGMAYISSWGEANPGGGKDRVELFIERARKNVVAAYESLGTVIKILDLKP